MILVGTRPSGKLHLGHWFSIIKPARDGASVLVADYHAPSVPSGEVYRFIQSIIRFAPDALINLQSEHFDARFYFRLLELTSIGKIGHLIQFKNSLKPNAHLLVYPVLMAHDVAGYEKVLVGEDQRQHLEFAKYVLEKYNNIYSPKVLIPEGDFSAGRIRSLNDPLKKMSKSDPRGCVFLDDPGYVIQEKIKSAVTTEIGRENLEVLFKEFVPNTPIPDLTSNAKLKELLTEGIIETLKK